MQFCKYFSFLLIAGIPATLFAQGTSPGNIDITGLWKGTLYNDSAKKYYRYEVGISEEKGKLSGFSHTYFLVDNKEYYGVKKLKIKIMDGKIIMEDAGLIANNYPVAPAKHVRQLNVLTLEVKDSILVMNGPFSTNRTKEFSPLTGTISLQRKNDYWQSALIPHLQELGFSKELSFVKRDLEMAKVITANNTPVVKNKVSSIPQKDVAKTDGPLPGSKHEKQIRSVSGEKRKAGQTESIPLPIKVVPPAADIAKRVNVLQQTVYFNSDSLLLSLYDNGEVDGDTVSVLMNGKLILPREGLSTNAVQKTIYIRPDTDSIELVMYAENLGAIPPNTGLLVVHDEKNIYEIRFSGDLQKNASIILRRRKK